MTTKLAFPPVIEEFSFHKLSEEAQGNAYKAWKRHTAYANMYDMQQTLGSFLNLFPVQLMDMKYLEYDKPFVKLKFIGDLEDMQLTNQALAEHLLIRYDTVLFDDGIRRIVPLTGYFMDYLTLQPLYDFLDKPDHRNFLQLLEDCAMQWAINCAKDYEQFYSRETFEALCFMHNWKFLKTGRNF